MKSFIFFLVLTLFGSTSAFAVGGQGATCNPSTPEWGKCTLATVPFRASVTNRVNIPEGHYTTPFQADRDNTQYVLQGDLTADGTAISVVANYVIINLNGYTITYNQKVPGEGVTVGAWNKNHIAVINGSIIQGAAQSEGDVYGGGNNPVSNHNTALGGTRPANDMFVANLYLRYGGRDVGGIYLTSNNATIEQNTVEDTYEYGTVKNRHQGIDAIAAGKGATVAGVKIANNTVVNCRHRGIGANSYSEIHGNHITTRSIAPNAYGIMGYGQSNTAVYGNTIIARGEHGIGIGFVYKANNIEIYDNYIDAQTTRIGLEYGSDAPDPNLIVLGLHSSGFRTTWGATNLSVHDNVIIVRGSSDFPGTFSPTGAPVRMKVNTRGLWIGSDGGEQHYFNNTITAIGDGGEALAKAVTIASGTDCRRVFVYQNSISSTDMNVCLGDGYGGSYGYPLFSQNTLTRDGSFEKYVTIGSDYGGYSRATGRFIDNIYNEGAGKELTGLNPSGREIVDVYFGTLVDGTETYDYRLHDNNGTSDTLLEETFSPPTTLGYSPPNEPFKLAPPKPPVNLKIIK